MQAPLVAVFALVQSAWASGTCEAQKCQPCSENVSCRCPSTGETLTIPCEGGFANHFDARTGEAICGFSNQENRKCLNRNNEFRIDKVTGPRINGFLSCSDVMKKGCVHIRNDKHKFFKCWCESLGKQMLLEILGFHLAIYHTHTGELLCPLTTSTEERDASNCSRELQNSPSSPPAAPPTSTPATPRPEAETLPAEETPAVVAIVGATLGVSLLLLSSLAAAVLFLRRRREHESTAAPLECTEENELYGVVG